MKEHFLRPPRTPADWAADALRVVGVLAVVAAAVWWGPTDAGIAALALPALVLPRMLGVRGWFDVLVCVTVLAAAWSNVFDLYTSVTGWDLLLHFVCTGVLAIVAALGVSRAGVVEMTPGPGVPRRRALMLVPTIALAISALWEMVEWIGWSYLSDEIFVTYQDTIGDMVFGGLGGVAAGALLATVPVLRPEHTATSAGA